VAGLETLIRDRIAKLNPRVRVNGVMSFEEYRRIPLLPQRGVAVTASVFGSLALILTLIGLYALISSSVIRRTREIGIRIALGGDPRKIQRLVLLRGMVLVMAGIGVGLVAAASLTQFMSGILFEVSSLDPLTYVLGALFMIGVTLLASLLPALRVRRRPRCAVYSDRLRARIIHRVPKRRVAKSGLARLYVRGPRRHSRALCRGARVGVTQPARGLAALQPAVYELCG